MKLIRLEQTTLKIFKNLICIQLRYVYTVIFFPFYCHFNLLLLHQIRCHAVRLMQQEFFRFVLYSIEYFI